MATSATAATAQTPLMLQYRDIKSRHPNAILFFRMGEFYEMFYEDAETASRILGLTLTSRNNGGAAEVPLAGIPVKAAADYVRRLVQHGHRVAICEQVEDPKLAKGVVRREVIETVSPGAVLADDLLDGARNNFVAAVAEPVASGMKRAGGERVVGVAAADVSTGELRLALLAESQLDSYLARLAPRELLLAAGASGQPNAARAVDGALVTEREAWEFDAGLAAEDLVRHFRVHAVSGLGLEPEDAPALGAAGALLRYLRELQPSGLPQLGRPTMERPGGVMPLDEMTRRNLELVESLRGGTEGTLLSVLDRTQTPMGARLLHQWVLAPLTEVSAIVERQDGIAALVDDAVGRESLRAALDGVRDLERLAAKAAAGRSTPRELGALGASLARVPAVVDCAQKIARGRAAGLLGRVLDGWDSCDDVARAIRTTLVERPPLTIGEEDTIAPGVDAPLDQLRTLRDGGKDAIAQIQAAERARTGIASLKVGFNKVFGYYIEVTRSNLENVPDDYQRRQTISNGERFVTPALKEYEEQILNAADRIETRERELFERLRAEAGAAVSRLQAVARGVAALDVLTTLADVAAREGYVRPDVTDAFDLEIDGGRHPVVERMMARDKFIPNDVRLTQDARVVILTGPNMAGKSTILRQVGLIVLMAQMGSYVPARAARVGVADRVFTRVGASDNLVRGQSTFMVEMAETSAILHTATARSLVLLDEIGRGTSTYDGVSIAWSVSEHLHDAVGCRTIFATHYHELTQLADELAAVRNFTVEVREVGDQVLFLHRLIPGGADRSYGIEVGRLAGLPDAVIARARAVLALFEAEQLVPRLSPGATAASGRKTSAAPVDQLGLFAAPLPSPAVERLKALDVNNMTPLEALGELARLAELARRG